MVIKLGEYDIKDMMGYMTALSKFEKGNTTTAKIVREGKTIEAEVTF